MSDGISDIGGGTFDDGLSAGDMGAEKRIQGLLEHPQGRRPEELLDLIAEVVGSPRRFAARTYQKSLG